MTATISKHESSEMSDPTTSKAATAEKKVRFSSIEIREHCMTLGDNPSVSAGVPVMIEWEQQATWNFSVHEFEKVRPERRDLSTMRVSLKQRATLVTQKGFSTKEVNACIGEMQDIQKSRNAEMKEWHAIQQNQKKDKGGHKYLPKFMRGRAAFKFGDALEPEDFARQDLPDWTKLPISASCIGLKKAPDTRHRDLADGNLYTWSSLNPYARPVS